MRLTTEPNNSLFHPTSSPALKFSNERVDAHPARLVSSIPLVAMSMLHQNVILRPTLNIFFPALVVTVLARGTRRKDSSHVSRQEMRGLAAPASFERVP
jgi:hypothetical protein